VSVKVLGIEIEPLRGTWPSVRGDDGEMVGMVSSTTLGRTRYAAIVESDPSNWTLEGPWAKTPELAAEALHATIRKLAEMEGKR